MARVFRALVFVLGFALIGGDGSLAIADAPVDISVRADIEGGTLRIRGTATVPDDAWIIYTGHRTAPPRRRFTGYAKVEDERFAAEANVSDWPPGEIAVDAHFQMLLPERVQPGAVIARYGAKGERMTGDDIVEGGASYRFAVASTTVVKPP